ncbi:tripartite tricarboxylate transporter TctB family protein [Halomonas sp. SpR8]|uniref:tripartite tricarboxylate transporter TctB family protein n=1 Tax=Halomonas sp. SpR8 TaxID=3050463 RepID=UPI0027E52E8C|nr:tripartite tricarboxylate transporter TctB family protein [Halomonas sp. SpR8]MDQ7727704.1 tripartite tricarboxylate transporter TctB family protein [Halomonas sp. SpR8]
MLTLTKDRALALALLLIVAVMWVESGDIRPPTSWQPYGSALFPRILLVVIGVLSLMILVRSLLVKVPERVGAQQLIKEWFQSRHTIVALFLLFGLYAALLPLVGYITATIGFLVASLALLMGTNTRRKWIINLTLSFTLTLVIFVVFRYGLNVWLP